LKRFPRLAIALDHGARPRLEGGPPYTAAGELFALAAYQGVFLKITSVTIQRADREPGGDARQLIRRLADGFGADRLAWGSNFPASQGSLSDLREAAATAISELTESERASFLGGTAARIYPRLAD
jgi:predicted TIM-barrel fold metal-dependent hydrolase